MKRWYTFIESYSPKIIFKPGSTNVVADALSRSQINNLTDSNETVSDQNTQHSAESSFENVIQETRKPLNQFELKFSNKFPYIKIFVQDVENHEDRALVVEETHCRAHRGLDENYKQVNRLYYWPNLNKKLQEYIKNCTICNSNKFNRPPVLIPIKSAYRHFLRTEFNVLI